MDDKTIIKCLRCGIVISSKIQKECYDCFQDRRMKEFRENIDKLELE